MSKLLPSPITHFLQENKEWILSWLLIITSITLLIKFWPQPPSPVPALIKSRINFVIIYPQGYSIDAKSWKYMNSDQTVEFSAAKAGVTVVFTEEETPLAYQNDVGAYNRFIGSLRPRATFDVPLGTVALSNFVTSGDYQVVGETGLLNAKGTFLFAHPNTQISDDEWRSLFESLKAD